MSRKTGKNIECTLCKNVFYRSKSSLNKNNFCTKSCHNNFMKGKSKQSHSIFLKEYYSNLQNKQKLNYWKTKTEKEQNNIKEKISNTLKEKYKLGCHFLRINVGDICV